MDNKRSITERLQVDWLAISPPGHIVHQRLSAFPENVQVVQGEPLKLRTFLLKLEVDRRGVRDRVTLFHLGAATVKIFLHSGCEGVFCSHWLVGRDAQCSLVSGAHMASEGKYQGASKASRGSRWMWSIHFIYEDPLGCAIASSWNYSENKQPFHFQ